MAPHKQLKWSALLKAVNLCCGNNIVFDETFIKPYEAPQRSVEIEI